MSPPKRVDHKTRGKYVRKGLFRHYSLIEKNSRESTPLLHPQAVQRLDTVAGAELSGKLGNARIDIDHGESGEERIDPCHLEGRKVRTAVQLMLRHRRDEQGAPCSVCSRRKARMGALPLK